MVAVPLTDILRQKESFIFGIEQERAFQKLKYAPTQAPVLRIFDQNLPGRVLADTSSFASGAILESLVDKHWHPVEYSSKRLSDVESCWSIIKRELLHCILAVDRSQPFFVGQPFEIVTDHVSLWFFISQLKLSRRQTHWLESLADFQPTFTFKPGKLHAAPDALSRIPAIGQMLQAVGKCHGVSGRVVSIQPAEICNQALLEAVHQAQQHSTNQEFLNFKRLATQASSGFSWYNGLVAKKIGHTYCIVLPGDASQLKETVFNELYASPLGGH